MSCLLSKPVIKDIFQSWNTPIINISEVTNWKRQLRNKTISIMKKEITCKVLCQLYRVSGATDLITETLTTQT